MTNDEWTNTSLGDVVKLLTGFPFKSSQFSDDPTNSRLLRGDNVVQGAFRWDGAKYWPLDQMDGLATYSLRAGDVILAMDRPWIEAGLKRAMVRDDDLPALLVQRVSCLRTADRKVLDQAFLRYVIEDPTFTEYILAVQTGTSVPHISGAQIKGYDFALPPLPEQRAIARVLGGLDDKIELNRRMNRTLEDLARGLFRSWFVDFDPVVKGASATAPAAPNPRVASPGGGLPIAQPLWPKRLIDSPLGPIPEGWRAGSIADLARYVNGRNFTKNASGTGRMVVRIAELNSGPGGSTVYNDVNAEPENVVHPGDLLFAWSGSLDVYRWNRDEALVNQHIFKVVCEAYPQWFVHFHLCEAMPFFQGIAADKATTMGHIKREHLRQAELTLPPDGALEYAGKQIEPMYARLLANERESLRLAATRDALLPVLLSGELRLAAVGRALVAVSRMATGYSPASPEDDCFWRAVASAEAAIFEDSSQAYGLGPGIGQSGLVELHSLKSLAGKKCARFFWAKKNAIDWAKANGEGWRVLRVSANKLQVRIDFEVWEKTTDIILDGAKAREFGVLHDPDKVP